MVLIFIDANLEMVLIRGVSKTTVVHHSSDFDGIFCREIARKFLPTDTEFIGWDFANPPLGRIPEGVIYVLDLPVDRPFGFDFAKPETVIAVLPDIHAMKEFNERLRWIDHHQTSVASHPADIPGYRIDGVAACRLAFAYFTALDRYKSQSTRPDDMKFFHETYPLPTKEDFLADKVSEPLAVRLAGKYDVWQKDDPRAEVFQFGLRSRELSESDWANMLSVERPTIEQLEGLIDVGHQGMLEPEGSFVPPVVLQLLEAGNILQRYQQRNDASMMHRSFLVEFEGLKFLALNTARCNSLTFAAKDVPETGHDALMGFYFNGSGKWTVSLYHAKHRPDLDLSQIAVTHGGGGHRGACGFVSEQLPFIK